MYINSSIRVLKYWFKLLCMSRDRLPCQAYEMLLELDKKGKQCWASRVRYMLCSAGFGHVWQSQGVGDVKMFTAVFKQRMLDMFMQEWSGTIESRDRYAFYRSFKSIFEPEMFLKSLPKHPFRSVYAMLRANMLPINANTARFKDDVNLKYCPSCKNTQENEYHLLFICPLYSHIRRKK